MDLNWRNKNKPINLKKRKDKKGIGSNQIYIRQRKNLSITIHKIKSITDFCTKTFKYSTGHKLRLYYN